MEPATGATSPTARSAYISGDKHELVRTRWSTPRIHREAREAAGVPEAFIRDSVGIEDTEDLIADLEQALGS